MGEWILEEYWLRSFLSWSAPILLDVAVGDDVVQEPAHAVFTISKISFCTKPTVISSFSTTASFLELHTTVIPVVFLVSVFPGIRYSRYRYFSVGIVVL